jgi:anti-sigma-K factor RskA
LVNVDIAAEEITVRPLGDLTLADQSYELWLVPGSSAQPRSLGLITAGSDRTVPISAELGTAVPQAAAFAVSLEPAGGSPTGHPTGPVLYQGSILPVANPDR